MIDLETRERDEELTRPYSCVDCQRRIHSLEFDGRCRSCAGQEEPEEYIKARRRAAARQGHIETARVLRTLALGRDIDPTFRAVLLERAQHHEAWAGR